MDHDDALSMNEDEMEDIEDMNDDEIPEQIKESLRKRKLEAAIKHNVPELDEEQKEPPNKRAKLDNTGKNKPPQNEKNNNNNNNANKKKST